MLLQQPVEFEHMLMSGLPQLVVELDELEQSKNGIGDFIERSFPCRSAVQSDRETHKTIRAK